MIIKLDTDEFSNILSDIGEYIVAIDNLRKENSELRAENIIYQRQIEALEERKE